MKENSKIIILVIVIICFLVTAKTTPVYSVGSGSAKDLAGEFDGVAGIYAKNLRTGKTYAYNDNVIFPTASTNKLVLAIAIYKYEYPDATDDLKALFDRDIQLMMTVSDNNAFFELLDLLTGKQDDVLDKVIHDLQLENTQIHSQAALLKYQYQSVTTPREMAEVFEEIYWGKYLDIQNSRRLQDELANTIFHDEIPRLLITTKVMHKVGQLDDILCDVGIIDDGQNQILVSAYTKTARGEAYASDFIANISERLYQGLK